jgi:hypothetical protein
MDAFETIDLNKDLVKYHQIAGDRQFEVKIIRVSGFPSYFVQKCDISKDYDICLDKFRKGEEKGKQIISKT